MPPRETQVMKDRIENKTRELRRNRLIHTTLRTHITTKYLDGRPTRVTLKAVEKVLEAIEDRDPTNLRVNRFTEMLKTVKKHDEEYVPPEDHDVWDHPIDQVKNCIVRFWNVDKNGNSRLYGYRIGSSSKAWNLVRRNRLYIVDADLVEASQTIIQGERWEAIKTEVNELVDLMGEQYVGALATKDYTLWQYILRTLWHDDRDTWRDWSHVFDSGTLALKVEYLGTQAENPQFQPFEHTALADALNTRYMPSKHLIYDVNPECTCWDNMLKKKHEELFPELNKSCMAIAIVTAYKESYDKYYGRNTGGYKKSSPRELTLGHVHEVCKETPYVEGSEITLTYGEAKKFFIKYRLGLEVYNVRDELMDAYMPTKLNTYLRPRVLRMVYHDNHVEVIDKIDSFVHKDHSQSSDWVPPSTINIPGGRKVNKNVHMASSPLECFEAVREGLLAVKQDNSTVEVIYNTNEQGGMLELLQDCFIKHGYVPKGKMLSQANVQVISLDNIRINGLNVSLVIRHPCDIHGKTEVSVRSVDEYLKYKEEESRFNSALMNKRHLSTYGTDAIKCALDDFRIHVSSCKLVKSIEDTSMLQHVKMLDFVKHYASCLYRLPYIASISPFESFRVYSGEAVDEKKLYLVRFLVKHVIYNVSVTLMFGYELLKLQKRMDGAWFEIKASLDLITHSPYQVRENLERLWMNDDMGVQVELKKGIANKAIGMCGKKQNKYCTSLFFKNEDDALRYTCAKKGKIYEVCHDTWVVNKHSSRVELENGFVPIREQVLSMGRSDIFGLFMDLKEDGFKPLAIKTDAIYFQDEKEKHLKVKLVVKEDGSVRVKMKTLKFESWVTNEFGGVRYLAPKMTTVPNNYVQCECLDEKLDSFMEGVKEHKPTMVEAGQQLPNRTIALGEGGCGKSYTMIMALLERFGGDGFIVVVPYNAQAKTIMHTYKSHGVQAITYHRWKGEGIDGKDKKQAFDMTGKKAVLFDEIMLYGHDKLVKIWKHMEANPGVEYYATGDHRQLDAIGDVINNQRKLGYVCGEKLFPNVLQLRVNKRLREQDRERMKEIIEDIFSSDDLVGVVKRHFGDKMIRSFQEMKEKGVKRAVCLFNSSNKTVNAEIHKYAGSGRGVTLDNGICYRKGMYLICKESLRMEGGRMHPNYWYEIVRVKEGAFVLRDVLDETKYEVGFGLVHNAFTLPYCNTVHSAQGDSIAEPFVICDWTSGSSILTKNWFYTAISRCVSLDDVWFLGFSLYNENKKKEAESMVQGYRGQDRKAGREWKEEDYVTAEWILNEYRKCSVCKACGEKMVFEKNNKRKVTVNRLDNGLGHVVGNCELMCKLCNCSVK